MGEDFAYESWEFLSLCVVHAELVAGMVLGPCVPVLPPRQRVSCRSRNAFSKAARGGGFPCSSHNMQLPEHRTLVLVSPLYPTADFCKSWRNVTISVTFLILSQIWAKLTMNFKTSKGKLTSRQHGHKGSRCFGEQAKGKPFLRGLRLKILNWCHK